MTTPPTITRDGDQIEVSMRNTTGQPERYRFSIDGTYSNGNPRPSNVLVHRPNGSWAELTIRQRKRAQRVLMVAKPAIDAWAAERRVA